MLNRDISTILTSLLSAIRFILSYFTIRLHKPWISWALIPK